MTAPVGVSEKGSRKDGVAALREEPAAGRTVVPLTVLPARLGAPPSARSQCFPLASVRHPRLAHSASRSPRCATLGSLTELPARLGAPPSARSQNFPLASVRHPRLAHRTSRSPRCATLGSLTGLPAHLGAPRSARSTNSPLASG